MAKLINGNGNPAVYANEDSDWFAAIMGNQTSITAIGEQFRADQADANTIEVFDGVIITKEGRRIQLGANQVDLFEIPTGTQGQTNYYIIGYHLYTDTDSNQFCEVFVQLMESASDTIPEDTFRGGADEVFVSLYRVTQVGLNITDIDLLLPTIKNILQINADLSEILEEVSKMGVPLLDFANPIFKFTSSQLTFTATKECYVTGTLNGTFSGNNIVELSINNVSVFKLLDASSSVHSVALPYIKIKTGDVVSLSTFGASLLGVYDVVS